MMRPAFTVAADLQIPEASLHGGKARVDAEVQGTLHVRLTRQSVGQQDQVVHVEAEAALLWHTNLSADHPTGLSLDRK